MKNKNFTLIELLITIAIIAILAAMLFPAISHVRNSAKETKAKAEMQAIETAIKSYEATYGILPNNSSYANLMGTLTNVSPPTGTNDRGIRFLDVQNGTTSVWVDPWGNQYNVFLDSDYDGRTTALGENLYDTVLIYSTGKGGGTGDYVYSWK